ncbi:EamA family transporter, partial [Candidatus Bipolaricaulota bacterium]|nr:EamA family transporter [Candidatus Bipolaricaulota bacterium]
MIRSLVSRRILPIAEMVLVAAIWGSSFVGVKMALAHAGPLTIAALRYSIAAVLLLPWVLKTRMRASSLHRPDW